MAMIDLKKQIKGGLKLVQDQIDGPFVLIVSPQTKFEKGFFQNVPEGIDRIIAAQYAPAGMDYLLTVRAWNVVHKPGKGPSKEIWRRHKK